MKNLLRIGFSLSLILILGNISMAENANSVAVLEADHWHLVQYLNASDDTSIPLDGNPVSLQLSEGKISGNSGCNNYLGSYSVAGEKLDFAQSIGATMKLCPPPVMELEQTYFELLSQVKGYHIDDETLVLLNQAQQPVLKFLVQQPAELEKTQWQAAGINNGRGGVVSSASTGLSTARFLDGKLTGNAGCNQYSAGYIREENKITIGPVMTTRKYCPKPAEIMQQEQEYLQAIAGTRIITLDTRKLELRNEEGALQVRFSMKADPEGAEQKNKQ